MHMRVCPPTLALPLQALSVLLLHVYALESHLGADLEALRRNLCLCKEVSLTLAPFYSSACA